MTRLGLTHALEADVLRAQAMTVPQMLACTTACTKVSDIVRVCGSLKETFPYSLNP
jgi:hypothetical protein